MRYFTSPVSPGAERRGEVKSFFREIRTFCSDELMFVLFTLIFPKPSTEYGMTVLYINLNDVVFQDNFFLLFKVFSVIENSELF